MLGVVALSHGIDRLIWVWVYGYGCPLRLGWEREWARVEGEERGARGKRGRGGPGLQPMAATQPVSPRHLCQHDAPHVKNVPRAVCLGDLQRSGRLGHHEMMAGLDPDPDLQCSTHTTEGANVCIVVRVFTLPRQSIVQRDLCGRRYPRDEHLHMRGYSNLHLHRRVR